MFLFWFLLSTEIRMRVYFLIIVVIATMLCSQYANCQESNKSFSFNIGLNLSYPTFIYFNEESFNKTIMAYQLGFNKDFSLNKSWDLTLSLGFNRNSFNAERQIGTAYSIKQIDLSYLSLEAGPSYKVSSNNLAFWFSPNLRFSRILSQNYSDYYTIPSLSNSDIGLNFKIGCVFLSRDMKPYLLFNYYYGLTKVAENSVVTGSGQTLNDYIKNRSIGFQLGFHF